MQKVYQTYCNSDMTEGRGPMVPSLCFSNKKDADAFVDEQPGVMGRTHQWSREKYGDWEVREIYVMESIEQAHEYIKDQTIRNALSKLTEEEKRALNLI